MKVKKELKERFWRGREVRQSCPLNLLLFNILLADMEEELRKIKWGGGNKVGGEVLFGLCGRCGVADG